MTTTNVAITKEEQEKTFYGDINLSGFIKSNWKDEKIQSWLDEEMGAELILTAPDGTKFNMDIALIKDAKWTDADKL